MAGQELYYVKSISIHALLAESDPRIALMVGKPPAFLSTLSLRRATTPLYTIAIARPYFYPRSPCGERLAPVGLDLVGKIFLSTLSLRRATCNGSYHRPHLRFLSTLSLRRATHNRVALIPHQQFLSTLSLRRATTGAKIHDPGQILFLSTLSLRRATCPPAGKRLR